MPIGRVFSRIHLVSLVLLALVLGYLVGRIVDTKITFPHPPITLRPDDRPKVPVIQIHGIRDGALRGDMQGDARLFIGEEMVIPDGSGSFSVAPSIFLEEEITILVPPEAHFVASRRGKYYYPVLSSQAEHLVPENRLYFRTEEEAQDAGFLSSSRKP